MDVFSWIQCIDAYATFLELLPAITYLCILLLILLNMKMIWVVSDWNWDSESITKANGFFHQLESSSYLLCFKVLLEIL